MQNFLAAVIKRFQQYEYWPWYVFYFPLVPYLMWLCVKARSCTFFSVVNPGIYHSGIVGEEKDLILSKLPKDSIAITTLSPKGEGLEDSLDRMTQNGLQFPIIAKPNIGERGRGVALLNDSAELEGYLAQHQTDTLLQEYLTEPVEAGVFYVKLPGEEIGRVISLTIKDFFKVEGNGHQTVEKLIVKDERYLRQLNRLKGYKAEVLKLIPANREEVLIEPIGNHCRGTKFINANHLVTTGLVQEIDKIARSFHGFYFGRFDLKAGSIGDLQNGRDLKIMELNGVTSELGHIYDPNYELLNAWKDVIHTWDYLYEISAHQIKLGHRPIGLLALLQELGLLPKSSSKSAKIRISP